MSKIEQKINNTKNIQELQMSINETTRLITDFSVAPLMSFQNKGNSFDLEYLEF
jgi:hypothetical protein